MLRHRPRFFAGACVLATAVACGGPAGPRPDQPPHLASPNDVVTEVDRYIIYPGQATAYMLGNLDIRKARDEAQQAMGKTFDIKRFHDRVLEDGAVPVSFLHEKIRAWGHTK